MKIRSHYLGLVLVVCFTGRIAAAQTIDEKLEAMMKEQPTVGLSVAAVKDGKLIYTHSFGYKNLETKTPLSDNDIFRIASISKSFTSVGLMQMIPLLARKCTILRCGSVYLLNQPRMRD